ncbi:MAG: YfhO family protein, partial [Lachnospiraceae bacterium]|nr:YfhO family protein [Lachnospiraceae bacterium]
EALGKDRLSNLVLGNDTVTGSISLGNSKILCMPIPYSKGWKTYVDDNRVTTYCINEQYIGAVIPEGRHSVRFCYNTPLKKEGEILSLFGLICIAVIFVLQKRKS